MLYPEDYVNAGIPTLFNRYGLAVTRLAAILSSLATVVLMAAAFNRLSFSVPAFALLIAIGLGQVGLACYNGVRSSPQAISALFKYSSIFMLAALLLLAFGRL